MYPSAINPALYIHFDDQKVVNGLTRVYVDDSFLAGTPSFLKFSELSLKTFESRSRELDNFTFAGVDIVSHTNEIRLCQDKYIRRLQLLPADSNFEQFRSLGSKLAWIVPTRPDIACAVAQSAQVI